MLNSFTIGAHYESGSSIVLWKLWGTFTPPIVTAKAPGTLFAIPSLAKYSLDSNSLSQTSFGHISISSSTISMVSMAPESPWKDLLIDTSYVLKKSVMAEILGRLTGNHYGTIY